jgi:hypothetical protein
VEPSAVAALLLWHLDGLAAAFTLLKVSRSLHGVCSLLTPAQLCEEAPDPRVLTLGRALAFGEGEEQTFELLRY